jgi:signal transduction histidine kinase
MAWGLPEDVEASRLPCPLLSFDDGGRLRWANVPLRQVLGLAQDAPMPERFSDLLSPASRILFQSAVLPGLRLRGEVAERVLSLRCADGADLPVLANFVREPCEGGAQVHAALMPMRDRKRLEDELLGARASAEQVPGVLFQLLRGPDGHLSFPFASRGIQAILGVTPARARESASPALAQVHAQDLGPLLDSLTRSAEQLAPWRLEFRVAGADGQEPRWIEAQASAEARPGGGVLWHGYLHDVSERRALEHSLRERELAVRASQTKSAFLARVSHEMRTPLNAVLGFAQLLSSDPQLQVNTRQREQVSHIEAAAHSLLSLIDEVLDIERVEAGSMTLQLGAVPLDAVLQESADMLRLMAEPRGIAIDVHSGPARGRQVLADRPKLLQCLNNLVSNAIKYNRGGGRVTLAAETAGGRVRIAVQDTGPGMSAEQVGHLFEPFNRLGAERTRTQGSGLGLVITQSLVALMGGELRVTSTPGQGTCFSFELPLAGEDTGQAASAVVREAVFQAPVVAEVEPAVDAAVEAAGSAPLPAALSPVPAQDAAVRTPHLVYIEDNPVNQLLMAAIVERLPHLRLSMADSGAEGQALALADPPDLLLLDMHLPDTDGVALLAQLRCHPVLHRVPAVMVSANALTDHIHEAGQAGFAQYWVKPLELDKTLAALRAWFPPPG